MYIHIYIYIYTYTNIIRKIQSWKFLGTVHKTSTQQDLGLKGGTCEHISGWRPGSELDIKTKAAENIPFFPIKKSLYKCDGFPIFSNQKITKCDGFQVVISDCQSLSDQYFLAHHGFRNS